MLEARAAAGNGTINDPSVPADGAAPAYKGERLSEPIAVHPVLAPYRGIGNRPDGRLLAGLQANSKMRVKSGSGNNTWHSTVQRQKSGDGTPAEVPDEVHNLTRAGGGTPLEAATRAAFEFSLGTALDDARIHTGPLADSVARAIRAFACTSAPDIVFRNGQYQPGSTQGQRLLAHELVHVIQQRSGAYIPPGVSRPGDAAEVEAERLARQLTNTSKSQQDAVVSSRNERSPASTMGSRDVVQRDPDLNEPEPVRPTASGAGPLRQEAAALLKSRV
jgi:Domain of unknown function (DUF4157)